MRLTTAALCSLFCVAVFALQQLASGLKLLKESYVGQCSKLGDSAFTVSVVEVFAAVPQPPYASLEASQSALASESDSSTTPAAKLAQIPITRPLPPTGSVRAGRRSWYGGIWQHIAGSGGCRYRFFSPEAAPAALRERKKMRTVPLLSAKPV
ncbi:MAG TPA: hypothetical protein VGD96_17830 [Bradyrhizobium sp.]